MAYPEYIQGAVPKQQIFRIKTSCLPKISPFSPEIDLFCASTRGNVSLTPLGELSSHRHSYVGIESSIAIITLSGEGAC